MMIERLAIILLLALVVTGVYYGLHNIHIRRIRPATGTGLPSLLYFRSDSCAVCPTQGRFVDQLAAQWNGRLHIERIDAEREPDMTARYRVFTLPTTVLIDASGRVCQVNYGLTDARKLDSQLSTIAMKRTDQIMSAPTSTSIPSA